MPTCLINTTGETVTLVTNNKTTIKIPPEPDKVFNFLAVEKTISSIENPVVMNGTELLAYEGETLPVVCCGGQAVRRNRVLTDLYKFVKSQDRNIKIIVSLPVLMAVPAYEVAVISRLVSWDKKFGELVARWSLSGP